MQPDQEQAIEQFVLAGGGFLALHNAGWGFPWRNGYRRTLGGYWLGHPPMQQFHVAVVNDTHPVTAGVDAYDIVDEQHMLYFDYDRVTPLLVSQGQDGRQSVCGWAHTYGKGRVVYLPHGHTIEAVMHPSFQRLVDNAARGCLEHHSQWCKTRSLACLPVLVFVQGWASKRAQVPTLLGFAPNSSVGTPLTVSKRLAGGRCGQETAVSPNLPHHRP